MRTSALITTYVQTLLFAALGVRCVWSWQRSRERRSAHLAWAAGIFGLQSLISAASTTIYDQAAIPPESPPRWIGIVTGVMLYLAVYGFLLFLSDFIQFPAWIRAALVVITAGNIVLAIIERPDLRFDPKRGFVDIPGVNNVISYRAYIGYVLIYLAIAFGVLAVAFAAYGFRASGIARFRMLSVGSGFFLLFVVIGLLPRLIFGEISPQAISNLLNVVRYIALAAAPLLLLGFSPPGFVRRRFVERPGPTEPAAGS